MFVLFSYYVHKDRQKLEVAIPRLTFCNKNIEIKKLKVEKKKRVKKEEEEDGKNKCKGAAVRRKERKKELVGFRMCGLLGAKIFWTILSPKERIKWSDKEMRDVPLVKKKGYYMCQEERMLQYIILSFYYT